MFFHSHFLFHAYRKPLFRFWAISTPKTTSRAIKKIQNKAIELIGPPNENRQFLRLKKGYHAGLNSPRRTSYGIVMVCLTRKPGVIE
jgi:hypothetical protein